MRNAYVRVEKDGPLCIRFVDEEDDPFCSGDVWYYFGADGTMKTGWQKIGSQWYYFDDGAMKTGWLEDGESWYWFDSDGIMATGWAEINGQWEMFADSGAWMYTWDGN